MTTKKFTEIWKQSCRQILLEKGRLSPELVNLIRNNSYRIENVEEIFGKDFINILVENIKNTYE